MEGQSRSPGRRGETERRDLRKWQLALYGFGVPVSAAVVLVPGLGYLSQSLTNCEGGGPFVELNCELNAPLPGVFFGLLCSLVLTGVVVARWSSKPPPQAVRWLTMVAPAGLGLVWGVAALTPGTAPAVTGECYSAFSDARRPTFLGSEDAPRIAFEYATTICLLTPSGIAEPLYAYQSSGLLYNGLGVLSPDGFSVAFRSNERLYVGQIDGSEEETIFSDGYAVGNLAWSPDGRRIAFHPGGEFAGIWVIDADGSALTQLTDESADDQPTWSPDGSRIAFVRCARRGAACTNPDNLWVMNADGTEQRQITFGAPSVRNPAWSPTGDIIAFERDGWALWVVQADGTDAELRTTEGRLPFWSPNGRRIGFLKRSLYSSADDGIWTMNADGSDPQFVAYHEGVGISGISWLPDADPATG